MVNLHIKFDDIREMKENDLLEIGIKLNELEDMIANEIKRRKKIEIEKYVDKMLKGFKNDKKIHE